MKEITKKAVKVVMIAFTISVLIFFLIVSQDNHHIETCHDDDCVYCAIILVSQNVINLVVAFVSAIMVGVFVQYFLSRLREKQEVSMNFSLIFQKVQMNE